jgi:3-oxoacyl-[acyl-carrier-protein] synthase-3
MPLSSVRLIASGSYTPQWVVTNEDLSRIVDTSDEWIRTRTGIRERRIAAEGEKTSEMAVAAARRALDKSGLAPSDIDLLVVATVTGDYIFPSTACIVQEALGLRSIPSFDLSAACSGFIYSLEVAQGMLLKNQYQNALVIGADKFSSIVDWKDRGTCVLFGDGAGAVILSNQAERSGWRIVDSALGAAGKQAQILWIPDKNGHPGPEGTCPRHDCVQMDGREVFKQAVRHMGASVDSILTRNNLKPESLNGIIAHQANERIISALAKQLNLTLDKFFVNLSSYGNTSAASIPLAWDEWAAQAVFQSGDYALLVAFGAGLTWGATLLQYDA